MKHTHFMERVKASSSGIYCHPLRHQESFFDSVQTYSGYVYFKILMCYGTNIKQFDKCVKLRYSKDDGKKKILFDSFVYRQLERRWIGQWLGMG